jgi:hypothetical protein
MKILIYGLPIHKSAAFLSLALISIHIGLHWAMIMQMIKKALKLKRYSKVRMVLTRIATISIVLARISCLI